jgi:hypothetical protein
MIFWKKIISGILNPDTRIDDQESFQIISLINQSGDIKLAEHGIGADRRREVELLLKKINLPGAPKLHQP